MRKLTLARQFLLAASVVVLAGMATIGLWVTDRIKAGVMKSTAASAASHMDQFVAPLVQELNQGETLSEANATALAERLKHLIGTRVTSVKVWRPDGTVVYSNNDDLVGRRFAMTANMKRALSGEIVAELDGKPHEGEPHEPIETNLGPSLLEVYAPVLNQHTGEPMAVAEYYAIERGLALEMRKAAVTSWMVVGLVTLVMMSALYGIVAAGSRTIVLQRERLEQQIGELRSLLEQNHDLRERIQRAHQRSAIIHEQVLRRVGADLHDGPAQHLGLALLYVPTLEAGAEPPVQENVARVRSALDDAMREIRAISGGLAMPELNTAAVGEVIRLAVNSHTARTRTTASIDIDLPPLEVPVALKVCIYRFVQEGLNNAFKHAGGRGQRVVASVTGDRLVVEVLDQGPGLSRTDAGRINAGLGLLGLRDRIETLGGELDLSSSGDGSRLAASFNLVAARHLDKSDER